MFDFLVCLHFLPVFLSICVVLPPLTQCACAVAQTTNAAYKPGQATELLEQSLQKLKANDKDEFRSQAGKIISLMLENRLPAAADHTDHDQTTPFSSLPVLPIHPTPTQPPAPPVASKATPPAFGGSHSLQRPAKPTSSTTIYKTVAIKPMAPLPPLAIGSETHFEETFPSPPPPPPPMHSPPPLLTHSDNLRVLDALTLAHQAGGVTSLPSPPASPPPPPPPQAAVTHNSNHQHLHQHHDEAERAPVVLRQRAAAATGGAKSARDRRSFIDRDGGGSIYNALAAVAGAARPSGGDRSSPTEQQQQAVNNIAADALPKPPATAAPKPMSTISDDGLWNGAPPVCCVCQTKIQR